MRRIPSALSISLLGAALGVLAVGAAPAGAATFGPVLHAHPNIGTAPAGSHITSSVTPISRGHVEVIDGNGNLIDTPGTVPTRPTRHRSAVRWSCSSSHPRSPARFRVSR